MEITKGKWETWKSSFEDYNIIVNGFYIGEMRKEKDAILIADAGNTYQETNKLPSELAEANKELLEALRIVRICSNFNDAKEAYGQSPSHWTNVIDDIFKKHSNA